MNLQRGKLMNNRILRILLSIMGVALILLLIVAVSKSRNLEKQLVSSQAKAKSAEEQFTELLKRNLELETKVSELKNKNTNIQADLDEAEKKVSTSDQKAVKAIQETVKLDQEVKIVKTEIKKLQQEKQRRDVQKGINFQKEVAELLRRAKENNARFKRISEEVSLLKRELSGTKTRLDKLYIAYQL